jgi:hypothetical protein
LFLAIGGLGYLMAGGDPGEVERAKIALRSVAIGYGPGWIHGRRPRVNQLVPAQCGTGAHADER